MKKYILLVIGMLMIANNAVAESAFDKQGLLIAPLHLTLAEAYTIMKGHTKNANNQAYLAIFEMGVLAGIINTKSFERDFKYFSEKTNKCLERPIEVLNNVIFGLYEAGHTDGKMPFSFAMHAIVSKQCFNE